MKITKTGPGMASIALGLVAAIGAPSGAHCQIYNDGATVVVEEGAIIHLIGNLQNEGSLLLEGAFVVEGSIANAGAFEAGERGELLLAGDLPQHLSGMQDTPVAVFTAAGPANVVLDSPLTVTRELWFDGGSIELGDYDLTLLTGARIEGSPSAESMVVTNGEGALVLPASNPWVLFFPVGTINPAPAYTPVWVDLQDSAYTDASFIRARVEPESGSYNPSIHNFIDRAWFLSASTDLVLGSALVTFQWDHGDEFGEVGDLFGGLFNGAQLFLLESVDPDNRSFTASVAELGVFTAGEARAFEDPILRDGAPEGLIVPPLMDGGVIDLAGAYGYQEGFSFELGSLSYPSLFDRITIVDGVLHVSLKPGAVGESSVELFITNEYGFTTTRTIYITQQPDPRLVRSELNQLTGYFEQDFILENISAVRPLDIRELALSGLTNGDTVSRAYFLGGLDLPFSGGVDTYVQAEIILMPGESATLRVEYRSPSRQGPADIAAFYTDYGLFAGATYSNGWLWLRSLGWFHPVSDGWAFHHGLGWVFLPGNDPAELIVYRNGHGWLWTGSSIFPYLYDYSRSSWTFYLFGSIDPAWFYDFANDTWYNN